MNEIEKLRILLSHWIEHNNGHEEECSKWVAHAQQAELATVATAIEDAVTAMKEVNRHLGRALAEAGGPMGGHHHDHHHHDHHHDH